MSKSPEIWRPRPAFGGMMALAPRQSLPKAVSAAQSHASLGPAQDEGQWPDFASPFCAGAVLADPDDHAVDVRIFEIRVTG
jgi:hypothetical protein